MCVSSDATFPTASMHVWASDTQKCPLLHTIIKELAIIMHVLHVIGQSATMWGVKLLALLVPVDSVVSASMDG